MPTRHGAPLYSMDVIGLNCFPLWAGLFGPACLSTGRVSREMGDGILGGKKHHRVKWSVFFGGVGREDGWMFLGLVKMFLLLRFLIYLFVYVIVFLGSVVLMEFTCLLFMSPLLSNFYRVLRRLRQLRLSGMIDSCMQRTTPAITDPHGYKVTLGIKTRQMRKPGRMKEYPRGTSVGQDDGCIIPVWHSPVIVSPRSPTNGHLAAIRCSSFCTYKIRYRLGEAVRLDFDRKLCSHSRCPSDAP